MYIYMYCRDHRFTQVSSVIESREFNIYKVNIGWLWRDEDHLFPICFQRNPSFLCVVSFGNVQFPWHHPESGKKAPSSGKNGSEQRDVRHFVQFKSHEHMIVWLVVSNMTFIFHNIWDNPSHWLIFFRGVETTNQLCFSEMRSALETTQPLKKHATTVPRPAHSSQQDARRLVEWIFSVRSLCTYV